MIWSHLGGTVIVHKRMRLSRVAAAVSVPSSRVLNSWAFVWRTTLVPSTAAPPAWVGGPPAAQACQVASPSYGVDVAPPAAAAAPTPALLAAIGHLTAGPLPTAAPPGDVAPTEANILRARMQSLSRISGGAMWYGSGRPDADISISAHYIASFYTISCPSPR